MKKSKQIALVLITAALASCHKEKEWNEDEKQQVYMRGDSTAKYTQTVHHHHHSGSNALLWYMAFRPYGVYSGGAYHHVGMYGTGLSESSNVGRNFTKSTAVTSSRGVMTGGSKGSSVRGGFGSSSHFSSAS